jgi:type II secretory pathway component PulF
VISLLWHTLIWLVVWFLPVALVLWPVYFLITLPLRRQERARFFLDLVETGLKEGRAVEPFIVAASGCRDRSVGVRFHLLAAYLENGWRLGQALERVPRFLPPPLNAMLKVGEEIGDLGKVLPACRRMLDDGVSQTRGALNYLIVLFFVFFPLTPAIFLILALNVFPRFLTISRDLEVAVPGLTVFMAGSAIRFAQLLIAVAAGVYLLAAFYIAGPRAGSWLRTRWLPLSDWVSCRLPWRRKRMQREFAAMLAILLDAGVPEPRAVRLAGACTANWIFSRRADQAADDLATGLTLPDAVRRLDDTGELRWRLANALQAERRFLAALSGWLEALEAKAFQQEQTAAQAATTGLVLFNGLLAGLLAIASFQALIAIIEAGILW